MVATVIPASRAKGLDPLDLQLQLQRFADEFCSQTSLAIDEYVRRVGTDVARIDGLKWKVGLGSAAVSIASGLHPKANLLDLVALTTLTRIAIDDRMAQSTNVPTFKPFLDTIQLLETNVWNLAAAALEPPQIQELREAINGWHAQNPEVRNAFFPAAGICLLD